MLGSGGTQERLRDDSGTGIEPLLSVVGIVDKDMLMKDGSSAVVPLALSGGA